MAYSSLLYAPRFFTWTKLSVNRIHGWLLEWLVGGSGLRPQMNLTYNCKVGSLNLEVSISVRVLRNHYPDSRVSLTSMPMGISGRRKKKNHFHTTFGRIQLINVQPVDVTLKLDY